MPRFADDFDRAKEAVNVRQHHIDFTAARRMWDDPDLVEITARYDEEPRVLAIGQIDGKLWAAVYTIRHEEIRFISVHRAEGTRLERIYRRR